MLEAFKTSPQYNIISHTSKTTINPVLYALQDMYHLIHSVTQISAPYLIIQPLDNLVSETQPLTFILSGLQHLTPLNKLR